MDLEVVLIENHPKLGERGRVVKVSPGYAINCLIPQKKARLATPANLKSFEAEKAALAKKESGRLSHAKELARRIAETSLTIEVQVGAEEKLYGAVTSHEIHQSLLQQGIHLERKDIHLEEPIRKLGSYQVPVKLLPEVNAVLRLWVVKKK